MWYRLPSDFSLPGHCAECGTVVSVNDAYENAVFNSNLDEKLGIRSREVLCYPLRGSRGAGAIIGVLMCTNKHGGFDGADEDALATVASGIADDLHSRFRELVSIADIMYGSAVLVQAGGGALGLRRTTGSSLQADTAARRGARVEPYSTVGADRSIHDVHEASLHYGGDTTLNTESEFHQRPLA